MANDGVDNYGHWWKNKDNIRICVLASRLHLYIVFYIFSVQINVLLSRWSEVRILQGVRVVFRIDFVNLRC